MSGMHLDLSNKTDRKYREQVNDRLQSLRPNIESEKKEANIILEKVRNDLYVKGLPFTSAEYKMNGSMEKDTMVSSRKEIDIVISIPQNLYGFPTSENTILHMKEQIALFYNITIFNEKHKNVPVEIHQFTVDLLPTFNIDINDFLLLSKDQIYIFKAHVSLYHVDFVHSRGKKFQDFCRLIKYWAHGPTHKENQEKYTSSFFLELMAADIFERGVKPNWRLIQLFEAFLRRTKNILRKRKGRAKFFGFNDYYKANDYRKSSLDKLLVLDPVDPDDNVALKSPQNENLLKLVERARETLKQDFY
ncbi:MAG: hypothetical protein GPJ54_17470 [Candidatus Heimdallarchaeota archaeon]|nr:hypothetical protein [Candidatus Heimdallarchaeota archaeon]